MEFYESESVLLTRCVCTEKETGVAQLSLLYKKRKKHKETIHIKNGTCFGVGSHC